MDIGKLKLLYFSPTGTTKRTIEYIASGMQTDDTEYWDLTTPDEVASVDNNIAGGLAIIGAPVYGGRIPIEAVQRFRNIKAKNVPAVFVVVYGNRAYEDALLELKDLAEDIGFIPIAGGAFIGEHSLLISDMPIAQGRPDSADEDHAYKFGKSIKELLPGIDSLSELSPLQVPGNVPYKERRERQNIAPLTDEKLCTSCGDCVVVCPTGSIQETDPVQTDPTTYFRCCACIRECPAGAKYFDDPGISKTRERLHNDCSERREPETYLRSTS